MVKQKKTPKTPRTPIPQAELPRIIKIMCTPPMENGKPTGPSAMEKALLWTVRYMNSQYGPIIGGLGAQDFFQQAVFELLQGNRHAYPIPTPANDFRSQDEKDAVAIRRAIFGAFRSLTDRANKQRVFSSRFDEEIIDLDDLAGSSLPEEKDPATLLHLLEDPEARQVAELLLAGWTRGEIAISTGKSSDSIYQIISRKIRPIVEAALAAGFAETSQP